MKCVPTMVETQGVKRQTLTGDAGKGRRKFAAITVAGVALLPAGSRRNAGYGQAALKDGFNGRL